MSGHDTGSQQQPTSARGTHDGVLKSATVAVIGNPNTGKTTLFNALTGLRQHVGNYPGVTVERKVGVWKLSDALSVDLVDLPGTYSLAARSPDEMIAVDVLLGQQKGAPKVDAILAIADASNPERNFYLISQLCELELPVVIALNMCDVAESKGISIDAAKLSEAIGTPVVPICANKRKGIESLSGAVEQALINGKPPAGRLPQFPEAMRAEISALTETLHQHAAQVGRDVNRLEAFRVLVDKGGYAEQRLAKAVGEDFCKDLEERRKRASKIPLPAEEVRVRYAWVKSVLSGALTRPAQPPPTSSDKIDKVLTHWFSGTLVFALLMLLVFQAIFSWASPLMDGINAAFEGLNGWVSGHMAEGTLRSLICDGVIAGVGGVLVFLPQICILFAFIAILEDCGYMSRAAFLMDRLFSRLGLSGKSFIPMLSSFACAVPGIMAARTIENPRDRLATILIAPLMSCSARLPVYIILIKTFIPETKYGGDWLTLQGLTLFAMYCVGILVAVPVAWLLKKTLLKGETPPFLIELPSYKTPDWKTVLLRVYTSGKAFTIRAGTIILAVSIIVWALAYFPRSEAVAQKYEQKRATAQAQFDASAEKDEAALQETLDAIDKEESGEYLRQSYFGRMGHAVEPAFKPLGWDWRISMAAIASFPAREVIVATLGTIFNLGADEDEESDTLRAALKDATWDGSSKPLFSIPVELSIMVFFALCSQCAATLATIKRETNSWKWPLFSFTYMTVLAYVGALITFQIASRM
ncbi:MAG TPA: ferrous iron transport protein B [Planctomycetota bacterium]|nr:ferrous iron transport protein B [Planctomycetota bacterium]